MLRSSGTASRPKVLYHSWDFTDRVGHLGVRGVRAALETPPNRVANCLFAGDLNGAFLFVQDITRSLPALSFAMGEYTSPAEAAAIIEAHGIDTLVASPAYGAELLARGPRRAPAAAAELPLHRRVAGSRAGAHGALGRTGRHRAVAGLFDVRDRSSGLPVPPPDGRGAPPPRGRHRGGGHRRGRQAGASRHARRARRHAPDDVGDGALPLSARRSGPAADRRLRLRQRRPIGLAPRPHAELDDGRHDHVLQ